jgi:two-component system sporulation sensor kinase B
MNSGYALNEFLINVFFVLAPLIFYPLTLQDKMKDRPLATQIILYFIFAVPMIACMFFPIIQENGMIYDLRFIPLLLGYFYASPATATMLFVSLVSVRFMIGGSGAYLNLVSSSLACLIIVIFMKKYRTFGIVNKVLCAFVLSFLCKFVGITSGLICNMEYSIRQGIIFFLMQSVFMAGTIYILETIIKNIELRKQIVDSEKMKVASVISASVAHEIRNPLTAVRGFIQLLSTAELTADKKQLYGKVCLDEIDRAQQIINDYLSLAKPHEGKIERLNISDELNYVGNVLSSYANLKNVEVQHQFEGELYVLGDRQKFRQSIINISKNGIEAMGDQGGVLKLEVLEQKDRIKVLISDTGSGMTTEQVRRLGTPYYSTKDKGTGLGTMVAFNIIHSMTGKVDIRSQIGEGTEYSIVFPKA